MQYLLDKNTCKKKQDSCINNKIQSNLLRFLRRRNAFYKTDGRFLNDKHYEVGNLPKIHKSKIIGSATRNEIIEIYDQNELELRPIVASLKCPTRKLS